MQKLSRLTVASMIAAAAISGVLISQVLLSRSGATDGLKLSESASPSNPPSGYLAGYEKWPIYQRHTALESLREISAVSDLEAATCEFLLDIIADKNRANVERNLAANALAKQGVWNSTLSERCVEMAQDNAEDPIWRDYALQHAVEVAVARHTGDAIAGLIRETVLAGGPSAGTALLLLQRLDENGTAFPENFINALVGMVKAQGNEVDLNLRLSLLGVLGERDELDHLPWVETQAVNQNAAVRRSAMGTLSQFGKGDAELAKIFAEETDESVLYVLHELSNHAKQPDIRNQKAD